MRGLAADQKLTTDYTDGHDDDTELGTGDNRGNGEAGVFGILESSVVSVASCKPVWLRLRRAVYSVIAYRFARFNEAVVGRELRMIELKKQIDELRAQLGQPPHYPLDFEKEGGSSLAPET